MYCLIWDQIQTNPKPIFPIFSLPLLKQCEIHPRQYSAANIKPQRKKLDMTIPPTSLSTRKH